MKLKSKQYFERTMLPHLNTSYHFALSLMKQQQDAEDAVQEAYIRAYRSIDQFSGENSTAWLLKIVRNTCITQLQKSKGNKVVYIDSQKLRHQIEQVNDQVSPESIAMMKSKTSSESDKIHNAIAQLQLKFREVLLLREFQDFSYKQISEITALPIGTVMSRLSRARRDLRNILSQPIKKEKGA